MVLAFSNANEYWEVGLCVKASYLIEKRWIFEKNRTLIGFAKTFFLCAWSLVLFG